MSWFKRLKQNITDWWRNDVRGNTFDDSALGDIWESITGSPDSRKSDGTPADSLGEQFVNTANNQLSKLSNNLGSKGSNIGNAVNEMSGAYAKADYEDAIADENASVAHKRQLELMDKQFQQNSPVAKSQELARAGLNPALASGVSNSVAGASAQMSHGGSANANFNPIEALFGFQKLSNDTKLAKASVRNTDAQTKLIESQQATEFEKGMSLFIENSWQKFISGDRGNPFNEKRNYSYRYHAIVDDDGNIDLVNYDGKHDSKLHVDVEKYKYHSETYGDFYIYDAGWKATKEREEISKLIGENESTSEELAQSLANFYLHAWEVANSGKQADASMLSAMAKDLETRYKYGDEFNAKWYIDTAFKLVAAGVDVSDAILKFLPKKFSPKGKK